MLYLVLRSKAKKNKQMPKQFDSFEVSVASTVLKKKKKNVAQSFVLGWDRTFEFQVPEMTLMSCDLREVRVYFLNLFGTQFLGQ